MFNKTKSEENMQSSGPIWIVNSTLGQLENIILPWVNAYRQSMPLWTNRKRVFSRKATLLLTNGNGIEIIILTANLFLFYDVPSLCKFCCWQSSPLRVICVQPVMKQSIFLYIKTKGMADRQQRSIGVCDKYVWRFKGIENSKQQML